MNIDVTARQFTGEVRRLKSGRVTMCAISERHFAGGFGDVWIAEDRVYEFALSTTNRFYTGECRRLIPADKQVLIAITEGDSWGRYAQGQTALIDIDDFSHLRKQPAGGSNLFDKSQRDLRQAQAQAAFGRITINELQDAIGIKHEAYLKAVLGSDCYHHMQRLVRAFVRLSLEMQLPNEDGKHKQTRAGNAAKQRLVKMLKELKGNKQ